MAEVRDPVCGMTFPEENAEELGALHAMHGGERKWFCCATCRDDFLKDPASFS